MVTGLVQRSRIWYLYHSGFAVKTAEHLLIFDYWKERPKGKGLDSGVVDPSALTDENVIVFASHAHGDHYNRRILSWGETIPNLRVVLSDDIPSEPGAFMIGPGKKLSEHDFAVEIHIPLIVLVGVVLVIKGGEISEIIPVNFQWYAKNKVHFFNQPVIDRNGG